jgi:hypothetical protein
VALEELSAQNEGMRLELQQMEEEAQTGVRGRKIQRILGRLRDGQLRAAVGAWKEEAIPDMGGAEREELEAMRREFAELHAAVADKGMRILVRQPSPHAFFPLDFRPFP